MVLSNDMAAGLGQALEELHTRIAATILGLDEEALTWQPAPTMQSVHDLIRHAAASERRWIGEAVAGIPVGDEGRFAMIQLSAGQPADNSLFELGGTGQTSQLIVGSLGPSDWVSQRFVSGRQVTVAECVLQVVVELARVLGHIENTCQLWDRRQEGGTWQPK